MEDGYLLADHLLTPAEVIAYLRVNVRTAYRLMRTGELPAVRVGRQWRVRQTDLDSWLRQDRPDHPWNRTPSARGTGTGRSTPRVPSSGDEALGQGELA